MEGGEGGLGWRLRVIWVFGFAGCGHHGFDCFVGFGDEVGGWGGVLVGLFCWLRWERGRTVFLCVDCGGVCGGDHVACFEGE